LSLAGCDRSATNPPEARRVAAARRTRHDPSLVCRCDGDLRGSRWIGQQQHLRVLSEECDVRPE
jgi:hypothetical protein